MPRVIIGVDLAITWPIRQFLGDRLPRPRQTRQSGAVKHAAACYRSFVPIHRQESL